MYAYGQAKLTLINEQIFRSHKNIKSLNNFIMNDEVFSNAEECDKHSTWHMYLVESL